MFTPMPLHAAPFKLNRKKIALSRAARRRVATGIESLENRLLMATHTWTGGGVFDSDWSTNSNWASFNAPAAGESNVVLIFPAGASRLANFDNISGLTVDSLELTGTGYDLTGSTPLHLNGHAPGTQISDSVGGNTLEMPLAITTQTLIHVDAGTLTLNSPISDETGETGELLYEGMGTVHLGGGTGNTYTGDTQIRSGIVEIGKTSGVAIPGDVTVGVTGGAPAVLRESGTSFNIQSSAANDRHQRRHVRFQRAKRGH